jgi:hypothetical protein
MTRSADIFSVLKGRQIPPGPPLPKWGTLLAQSAAVTPLCKRGARGDLKTLSNELMHKLTHHSYEGNHE